MTTTTSPDYWSILGIPTGSDISQIKSAFRKEARRWHPDLNLNDPNAEERFKLINQAYEILSDPNKRSAWESVYIKEPGELFVSGFPTYEEYLEVVLGITTDHGNNDKYKNEIDDNETFISDDFEESEIYAQNV